MSIDEIKIKVTVDIPAVDRLVEALAKKYRSEETTCGVPETKQEVSVVEKTEATDVAEETEDAEETACEPPVMASKEERIYTAEELANAAMALRDADKANAKRIKERYQEFGINSISDLKTNEAARRPFAEMLIAMGANL